MPMHRWMHRAAGGTSQRLKPAVAMMRSRSKMPGVPGKAPAVPIVVMKTPMRRLSQDGLRSEPVTCDAGLHSLRRADGNPGVAHLKSQGLNSARESIVKKSHNRLFTNDFRCIAAISIAIS